MDGVTFNLLLNEQKTEVVVIAAPNRSRVHSNVTVAVSIDVCGVSVMPKPSIRDIGVVIDDTMSMAVHVSRVCQVTYCQIRSIAKIRKCLTTAACKTIVHALVMSRVDYGNALLFGLPEMLLHKLQMIQNSAARLVTGTHGRDHITPVLFKLHWLPVRYRIEFKLLVLIVRQLSKIMGTRRTKAPTFFHVLSITIALILGGEPIHQEGGRRPYWTSMMAVM